MNGRWRIDRRRLAALLRGRSTLHTSAFDELCTGMRFGPYNECIVRLERRPVAVTPGWFDPKERPGHLAVHARSGVGVYLELAIDAAARACSHPFDVEILGRTAAATVEGILEPLALSREPTLFDIAVTTGVRS